MNIGIIDADLIGKNEHNFPNLALMKISGYHKKLGDTTKLIHYNDIISIFGQLYEVQVFFMINPHNYLMKLNIVCLIIIYIMNGF
jgi:hypothetical protein